MGDLGGDLWGSMGDLGGSLIRPSNQNLGSWCLCDFRGLCSIYLV